MEAGARAVISFCMRSAIPSNIVVPPDSTVLPYRSWHHITSQHITAQHNRTYEQTRTQVDMTAQNHPRTNRSGEQKEKQGQRADLADIDIAFHDGVVSGLVNT